MALEAEKRAKEAEEHLAAGRTEDAIAACREAIAIQPDCLPAHVCMAILHIGRSKVCFY